jgi:hypothetical protein
MLATSGERFAETNIAAPAPLFSRHGPPNAPRVPLATSDTLGE